MADYATKSDVQEIVNNAVTGLSEIIAGFAQQVDDRFTGLEARQDEFDRKMDNLVTTIDGFLARIDRYETEQAARDSQFEKLLAWAREVSEKTGIPLKGL